MEPYFPYLLAGLAALDVLLIVLIIVVARKVKRLGHFHEQYFQGKRAANLEDLIGSLSERVDKLDHDIGDLFNATNQINQLARKGLSKVGLVRFNPFGEKGHKTSFAVALVNKQKNGIIFSSLRTESGVNIYVKQVAKGKPDVQLTQEEASALESAK